MCFASREVTGIRSLVNACRTSASLGQVDRAEDSRRIHASASRARSACSITSRTYRVCAPCAIRSNARVGSTGTPRAANAWLAVAPPPTVAVFCLSSASSVRTDLLAVLTTPASSGSARSPSAPTARTTCSPTEVPARRCAHRGDALAARHDAARNLAPRWPSQIAKASLNTNLVLVAVKACAATLRGGARGRGRAGVREWRDQV